MNTPTPAGPVWHVTDPDLSAYGRGDSAHALTASVEAHLLACEECRSRFARVRRADESSYDVSAQRWDAVADSIDVSRRSVLGRLGLGTPPLLVAWGAAFVLAFLVPLVLSVVDRLPDALPLLVLAPGVPILATALAFRTDSDPAGELSLATPGGGFRLVVLRALVVGGAVVPVGLTTALVLGLPAEQALAWLLPGVALAAVVMLCGRLGLDPAVVASTLAALWVAAVLLPSGAQARHAEAVLAEVAGPLVQGVALAVALVATAGVMMRANIERTLV